MADALVIAGASALLLLWSAGTGAAQEHFVLTGEVGGLYPGVETTLAATVTNPQSFAIEVTSVGVSALDASPNCPGSLLAFGTLASSVTVPPGATTTVPLAVRLDLQTPDACQGAVWPLEFTGTAISEDGPPVSSPSRANVSGAASGRDRMAVTGADVVGLLAIGVALLAAGAGARRRWGPGLAGGSTRQRRPR